MIDRTFYWVTLQAEIDQAEARIRSFLEPLGLDHPVIKQALAITLDDILYAAQGAEPLRRNVADAFYVRTMAWREAVK